MNHLSRRVVVKTLGLAAATSAFPFGAAAQSAWPTKPIRIIVPVAAGGIIDLLARNIAESLQPRLNATIVVESRPGADHVIGTQAVAKSEPDGYTWLAASVPFTTTWHLRNKPPFDPLKDFVPVSLLAVSPNVLVVPTTLGVNTFQEFIALGKKRPTGLTYANPGTGSSNHLGTEQLQVATGIPMLGVPYKGQPPAVTDLLTGRVDFMLMSSALVGPHLESGRLKALATVADTRLGAAAGRSDHEGAGPSFHQRGALVRHPDARRHTRRHRRAGAQRDPRRGGDACVPRGAGTLRHHRRTRHGRWRVRRHDPLGIRAVARLVQEGRSREVLSGHHERQEQGLRRAHRSHLS